MGGVEDKDFELLLGDRRHKELVASLKKIGDAIPVGDNQKVLQSIDKVAAAIDRLAAMKPKESHGEMPQKISELSNMVANELNQIKAILKTPAPKTEWIHKITKRNYDGFAEEIVSTPIK